MKDVFEFDNYKNFLKNIVYSPEAKRGFQVKIAKAIGCQAAYLSQILKGKADLTEDHAIKLTRLLGFSPAASEYFILLVRMARASTAELREYLEHQRLLLLKERREIQGRLRSKKSNFSEENLQQYFSSSLPSTVHMATSSEKFQTIEAIAERLRISPLKVREILRYLKELNVVEQANGVWKYSGAPMHFPRHSSINISHQISRRHQAIRAIEEGDSQDVHFSSIFTISTETYQNLRADLLNYVESSHKQIHESGTEDLYGICLDLFRIV